MRVLAKGRSDLVVMLPPGKGTGVIEHKREVRESVTYLGAVDSGYGNRALFHKFQNDTSPTRVESVDHVNLIPEGFRVDTMVPEQPGRFHGYHNPHETVPVALLIHKEFE